MTAPGAEPWVRMSAHPAVARLSALRWDAVAAGLRRRLPEARGLPAQVLRHPAAAAWEAAAQRIPPADSGAFARLKGLSGGLLASAAVAAGRPFATEGVVDNDGHLHLPILRKYLDFGAGTAGKKVRLTADRAGLRAAAVGAGRARAPASILRDPAGVLRGRPSLVCLPMAAPDLEVNPCDPLLLWPIRVHGVANLGGSGLKAFCSTVARSLEEMRRLDPAMRDEIAAHLRVLIPLKRPKGTGSVSSTYAELPETICLSHAPDTVLQQETLIHEYCHAKINLLSRRDPLLEPGQSNAVFYSPWREDPRPLRGLLLGAHAFLNVGLHLLSRARAGGFSGQRGDELARNIARRTFQVDTALRTVLAYGRLTPLGAALSAELCGRLSELRHALEALPPSAVEEMRKESEAHRAMHAFGTGLLHNMKTRARA